MYLQKNLSKYAVHYDGDYKRDLVSGKIKATKYIEITSEVLAKDRCHGDAFTKEYLRLLKEG